MPVALYMDEHVPRAITTELRLRGVDVLTTREDARAGAADAALLDRSSELARVLFTQDDDLVVEAVRRQREGTGFAGVVYAHQLRISIGRCIQELELLAHAATADEMRNRIEFLPLR